MNEKTDWLISPIKTKENGLRVCDTITWRCYSGRSKKIRLIRTSYTIGSAETCDIVFFDRYVSPLHARLLLQKSTGLYFIEDLNSQNGTSLNGLSVCRAKLPLTGRLQFGLSSIVFSKKETGTATGFGEFVAAEPASQRVIEQARKIADSDLSVLLLGPTGAGKDVLARAIHQNSTRRGQSFVALNCANFSGSGNLLDSELFGHRKGSFTGSTENRRGAFLQANNGTLFLDEIGEMPLDVQAKFLRALENREVRSLGADAAESSRFRLIAATNNNLQSKVLAGSFRADLFYRIADFVIELPALAGRHADIMTIAQKYVSEKRLFLDESARRELCGRRYPGNVRELISVLKRAALLAETTGQTTIRDCHIQGKELELELPESDPYRGLTLEEIERSAIAACLNRNSGSKSQTASELGISRSSLFYKIRKYQLAG